MSDSKKKQDSPVVKKKSYNFTQHGVVVEAANLKEATESLNKQLKSQSKEVRDNG